MSIRSRASQLLQGAFYCPVVLGRLNLIRIKLALVRLVLMQLLQVLLHNGNLTMAAADLHDDVHSQRIDAEQRQPNSQQHSNKFFGAMKHGCILARLICFVIYAYPPVTTELLAWGAFFKQPASLPGMLLVLTASLFLLLTAKRDEAECLQHFGEE